MNNADNNFKYPPNSIATFTGMCFDLAVMDPDSIDIRDIARALSMNCRWGGHVNKFYSVAEHSVRVYEEVEAPFKLVALLHDASEAYLHDMPKPFKIMLPDYIAMEDKLMQVIADKYGFAYPLIPEIKVADKRLLEWEWKVLKESKNEVPDWIGWDPKRAERMFLNAYNRATYDKISIDALSERK